MVLSLIEHFVKTIFCCTIPWNYLGYAWVFFHDLAHGVLGVKVNGRIGIALVQRHNNGAC